MRVIAGEQADQRRGIQFPKGSDDLPDAGQGFCFSLRQISREVLKIGLMKFLEILVSGFNGIGLKNITDEPAIGPTGEGHMFGGLGQAKYFIKHAAKSLYPGAVSRN